MVSSCTVAFSDTWSDAARHPQPPLCIPGLDHLQKALSTSRQKLKINKNVSQHSPQGEPGFARAAGTQAAGIGRSDPCQPCTVTCCNPGRRQPLQPGVRTADAPGGHPLSHREGQDHSQRACELAGREPCLEGSHCLFSTYTPHPPPFQYPLSGLVSSQSFLYFTFLRFNYVIRTTGIRIWSARIHISNCYQQRKWAQHAHARVDVGCSPQSTHGYL